MIGVLCTSLLLSRLLFSDIHLCGKAFYVRIGCIASAFSCIDTQRPRTAQTWKPVEFLCHALRRERQYTYIDIQMVSFWHA
jgi:hypothetical protein